jgi:hypothetical protein
MTTELVPGPSEQDIVAVEARLAAVYAALPPAQQAVVATVIAAGVETLAGADTRGYTDVAALYQVRMQELEQIWRQCVPFSSASRRQTNPAPLVVPPRRTPPPNAESPISALVRS